MACKIEMPPIGLVKIWISTVVELKTVAILAKTYSLTLLELSLDQLAW